MTTRTTMRGNAMPGSQIEYPGDLTPPTSTYASAIATTSVGRRLALKGCDLRTGAPVVVRRERRGRHGLFHFIYGGGRLMKPPVPTGPAYGSVINSVFQRIQTMRINWQINPSWHEAGYPRNLGLSQRTYQPQAALTGPGKATMTAKPAFTRVQNVPRARASIRVYPTRSAKT